MKFVYRFEEGEIVPYELIKGRHDRVVEKGSRHYDSDKGGVAKFVQIAQFAEDGIAEVEAREAGFFDSAEELLANMLVERYYKDSENMRKAGKLDGVTIARMRRAKQGLLEYTAEVLGVFNSLLTNPDIHEEIQRTKSKEAKGNDDTKGKGSGSGSNKS